VKGALTPVTSESDRPVKLFYSYSHEDERLRDKLDNHLALLQRQGVITEWHDRQIEAGSDWAGEINAHLDSADIILMLVSDDFIASDYCYSVEMMRALERHERGEARVIPIILRPVDWESSLLGELQALPRNAKPVVKWGNRDDAFKNIAQEIRKVIKKFQPKQKPASTPIPRRPEFGFVSRRDDEGRDIVGRLKEELAPGQNSLVTLSGPGGIGKTTLAAEAARSLLETYARRVVWSSADGRTDFTLPSLHDDIATQLGRPQLRTLAPEAKTEQVRALVSDPPALVVLDNCETIAPEEQQRIAEWFGQTPQCSALFTSRGRMPGTALVRVLAMSREEADEFLEKLVAQAQGPEVFTPDVRQRIYETAEANPFVMQWVTAQIDLAQEPDHVLEELKAGKGDAAQRVFDRSFNLPQLGDDGRDALLALSLFTPSAPRAALAEVAGLAEPRLNEAVKNLRALWLIKPLDANRRLAAEGLTRTLIEARLSKDSRAPDLRRRFIAYFLRHTEEHKEETAENYDALEAEKDNLLKAAEVAFNSEDFQSVMRMATILAAPVRGMLSVRGYWAETVGLGELALQAARSSQNSAVVFSHNLAVMYGDRGELNKARQLYSESLEISKRLDNQDYVASTLHELGRLAQHQGEVEEARRLYEESLQITKRLGDQRAIALTLGQLGLLAEGNGDKIEAACLFREALSIFERLGSPFAEVARKDLKRVGGKTEEGE